jgi:hypothetical protein
MAAAMSVMVLPRRAIRLHQHCAGAYVLPRHNDAVLFKAEQCENSSRAMVVKRTTAGMYHWKPWNISGIVLLDIELPLSYHQTAACVQRETPPPNRVVYIAADRVSIVSLDVHDNVAMSIPPRKGGYVSEGPDIGEILSLAVLHDNVADLYGSLRSRVSVEGTIPKTAGIVSSIRLAAAVLPPVCFERILPVPSPGRQSEQRFLPANVRSLEVQIDFSRAHA